jgi:hypothetical protein
MQPLAQAGLHQDGLARRRECQVGQGLRFQLPPVSIFTADGQYVVEVYRGPERTKFTAKDRTRGTPEAYRDAQLSTSTHFGRYTVDQAKSTISFMITNGSFPDLDGTTQVRPFTLQNDTLTWRVADRPDGSVPVTKFVRVR